MEKLCVVAVLCLLCCPAFGWQEDEFIQDVNPKKGVHWAVLVAGSNGWGNYRHQADACHAYQIMRRNGIPEERIITLMYDDLAHNEENPTPGIVINHPNGTDVYHGVQIDYRGEDVTPENFLAVLKGDASATNGGNGKVLKSGPNDHVFVNFVDHGGPGILAFPSSMLKVDDFIAAINDMHQKKMYAEAVFYIEACESGSMFSHYLSPNISVYATTASSPTESSYACYWDEERRTYLGDVYSVMWMEDSDKEDLSSETLHKQYKIVKRETNTSHVEQYGDKSIAKDPVGDFQGGVNPKNPPPIFLPEVPLEPVASEYVPLAIQQRLLQSATSETEELEIVQRIEAILQMHKEVNETIKHIVGRCASTLEQARRVLTTRLTLLNFDCYLSVLDDFHEKCFDLSKNDYAMRRLYVLVNLCEEGVPGARIQAAIQSTCIEDKLFNTI